MKLLGKIYGQVTKTGHAVMKLNWSQEVTVQPENEEINLF